MEQVTDHEAAQEELRVHLFEVLNRKGRRDWMRGQPRWIRKLQFGRWKTR